MFCDDVYLFFLQALITQYCKPSKLCDVSGNFLYKVSRCEQNLSLKYFEYLLKVTYTDLFVKTNFSLMNGKIIKVTGVHVDYSVPVTHRQEVISVCISYFAYFIIARAFIKTSATYSLIFTGALYGHL